ncbi:hypothetical protein A3F28_02520 [Candidatus Uhrbacteria bacterium RIFCSPHIGHO2_12_FULL_57_11]|uniref:EfeO-type cupredoxin-like domain-containing protein n=2 Tax=Candidatus Uhriibacteriota TaxID=1752732 RepID=A0A1F7ULV9_9BACT|nr:MAG: hypothetical protein A3D72_01785 [Candidatus Uhrbacteria bacterium RIFCSPHIGHO2_02_FULL_57_19]OGL78724.1 MAG: hypothetical protein A3F28_02520 [Candidatus Uhrbacteria bacterium RIFCSPHIGHO2_12_FULL_57_11]
MKRILTLVLVVAAAVVLVTAGVAFSYKRRAVAPAPAALIEETDEESLLSDLSEETDEEDLEDEDSLELEEEAGASEMELDAAEDSTGQAVDQSSQRSQSGQTTQNFTVEADDAGFYPSGTITVSGGARVSITFSVRATGVYFNGLEIKSQYFNTGAIRPGASRTVTFTAPETGFTFSSYWPNSNVKKVDGQVVVE